MGSMSMRYKLILLGLLPGIAILVVLLALVSSRMQDVVDRDMEILRNTLLEANKTELRNSLDIAKSLIKPLYDAALGGESPEKDEAIQLLNC
jgi:methyl-accepting chemotaxis protein